ncbi:hypothetical protein L9F63_023458, partial [Diploptera punctata]
NGIDVNKINIWLMNRTNKIKYKPVQSCNREGLFCYEWREAIKMKVNVPATLSQRARNPST